MKRDVFLERIKQLQDLPSDSDRDAPLHAYQLYMGCVTIISQLYGVTSVQMQALKDEKERLMGITGNEYTKHALLTKELHGLLSTVIAEIEAGLVESVEAEARGEIYADFIGLAKQALDQSSKDVAAVLASAALEDALKRFADSQGFDPSDKDMSEVISLLKGNQLLQKTEAKVVQSYVTLRNKALHAEWDKINSPEVSSLIGYVEGFVLRHFSGAQG